MSPEAPLPLVSRLSPALLERFLTRHGLKLEQIARAEPCWKMAGELVPLSIEDLEDLAAQEDPVAWARLRLTEERDVRDDDGNVAIAKGSPWTLFPRQEEMARLEGDLLFETGAECGKTRDICLQTLWKADTRPGSKILIATNSESTSAEIFAGMRYQVEENPLIAGGLRGKPQRAPFYAIAFQNDSEVQLRLVGAQGEQLRNFHGTDLLGDEAAKWKSPACFSELFRAALPGASIRIYSTPDGDFSSSFAGLCNRATPIDGRTFEEKRTLTSEAMADERRGFRKFNISKVQLPYPLWSERRAAKLLAQYGGEQSVGWQCNVLGRWGSSAYSLFPMPILRPNLTRDLPHYRIVVARVSREEHQVRLRVAGLGPEEELLADEAFPFADGEDLARAVARWVPDLSLDQDARLFCGIDCGSAWDPTEALIVRADGRIWTDVFRLHLVSCGWEAQADIVAALDHASGHRVRYAIDRGSAGAALVEALREREKFRTCPVCGCDVFLEERVLAVNFGEVVDEVNEAGEVVMNPERRNAAGEATPRRAAVKETATRLIERKVQAAELRIADDNGAGDASLGAAQLLTNHSAVGLTSRGERRFRGEDDHAIDARRLAAWAIAVAASEGLEGAWGAFDPKARFSTGGRLPVPYSDLVDGDVVHEFERVSVADDFGGDW